MTDCPRTGLSPNNVAALATFHAEVARLMSLGAKDFAALHPDALVPLVAAIRATPSEVSSS